MYAEKHKWQIARAFTPKPYIQGLSIDRKQQQLAPHLAEKTCVFVIVNCEIRYVLSIQLIQWKVGSQLTISLLSMDQGN